MATGYGPGSQKGRAQSLIGFVKERLKSGSSQGSTESTDTEEETKLRPPEGDEITRMHAPKSPSALRRTLKKRESVDVNAIEPRFERAPIHSIVVSDSENRHSLLQTLLTYSPVDVNLKDLDGMTPLHLAVKVNDIYGGKLLIAFGANVNALNNENKTPTDLAISASGRFYFKTYKKQSSLKSWTGISVDEGVDEYGFMLVSLPGADETGVVVKYELPNATSSAAIEVPVPTVKENSSSQSSVCSSSADSVFLNKHSSLAHSLEQSTEEKLHSLEEVESEMTQLLKAVGGKVGEEVRLELNNRRSSTSTVCNDQMSLMYEEGSDTRRLYKELDDELNHRNVEMRSISDIDDVLCCSQQRQELIKYRKTGSRILCLDGGGMKGLAEIAVMETLERMTGKNITELFDWIVGTSTGGIIALGLVYAKKSLKELRQLWFRLKDDVFGSPKFGVTYNTEALEVLLKESFRTEMKMSDIKHPKVLVASTYKGRLPLQLHLFNNCFDNELSDEIVWKVARSTCAGPVLFSEFSNYVDGGVLCNNPTEQGVAAIKNYHMEKGEKLPISLVVSIGSGVYPEKKIGSVDAQDCLTLTKMTSLKGRVTNLLDLFYTALLESETVAETCDQNFSEQGIPFYRFSAQLLEEISAGETDSKKLVDMIITTRKQTAKRLQDLVMTHFCTDGAESK